MDALTIRTISIARVIHAMKCRISLGATRPLGNEGVLDETGAISHTGL